MNTRLLAGSLILALAACGKPDPAPVIPVASAPAGPAVLAAPVDEPAGEPAGEISTLAVNEPLPPFEDDSGIVVISQSALQAAETTVAISGEVIVYEAPDGSRMLRLENLQTPRDLALDLALSPLAAPHSAETASDVARLGPLKGPSGNMNYLLERGTGPASLRSVLLIERSGTRILASAPVKKPQ